MTGPTKAPGLLDMSPSQLPTSSQVPTSNTTTAGISDKKVASAIGDWPWKTSTCVTRKEATLRLLGLNTQNLGVPTPQPHLLSGSQN